MKKYFIFGLLVLLLAGSLFAQPGNTPKPDEKIWQLDFGSDILPQGVTIQTELCWKVEGYLELYNRTSSLTVNFNLPQQDYSDFKLQVTDCGTALHIFIADEDQVGVYSPVNIDVNGQNVALVDILWTQDQTNCYPIGKYLKAGGNSITFSLSPAANTRYDLKNLVLRGELVKP